MFLLEKVKELDQGQRWNATFQMMQLDTRDLFKDKTQHIAKHPKNRNRNRYRDVLPYDDTRVVLSMGGSDYINANIVEVPEINRRYILAQGPLDNTCHDFWRMVWENHSEAIIMLCRIVESQRVKCHPYWPIKENELSEFGSFQIRVEGCEMEQHFITRHLLLTNITTKEQRRIKQFHFMTWPDFGVPENANSFVEFLNTIRECNVLTPRKPPVIHCSAGIGRSGTLILVDAALKIVEKNKSPNNLDIPKLLLSMREQRCGLVQTPQQYRFAWLAIVSGIQTMFPGIFGNMHTEEETNSDEESPPPLPEKSNKTQVPPKKPPRTVGAQEKDINLYNQLTAFSDEESGDDDEEDEYIDLSDPSFGSDGDFSKSSSKEKENNDTESDESTVETLVSSKASEPSDNVVRESKTGAMKDIDTDKSNDSTEGPPSKVSKTSEEPREVTNAPIKEPEIGSKARESEIRQRRRQEKKETTAKLVNSIKEKMKDSEKKWYHRTDVWVYLGVSVGLCAAIYAASRWWG